MRALKHQPVTREQAIARFNRIQEDARFLPRIAPPPSNKEPAAWVRDFVFFASGTALGAFAFAALNWGLR